METVPALIKDSNEQMDWSALNDTKAELGSIFNSLSSNLDQLRAMAEIAKERGVQASSEMQTVATEVLTKFQPGGEYAGVLYTMISDLNSVKSQAFGEGLLITQDELNLKLAQIKEQK